MHDLQRIIDSQRTAWYKAGVAAGFLEGDSLKEVREKIETVETNARIQGPSRKRLGQSHREGPARDARR
jgi:hypothetical protein